MMSTGKYFEAQESGTFQLGMKPLQRTGGPAKWVMSPRGSSRVMPASGYYHRFHQPGASSTRRLPRSEADGLLRLYPRTATISDAARALEKLRLNDAALTYEPECLPRWASASAPSFLGLLHMEIVQERLEREYNMDLVATHHVVYRVDYRTGEELLVDNPASMRYRTK